MTRSVYLESTRDKVSLASFLHDDYSTVTVSDKLNGMGHQHVTMVDACSEKSHMNSGLKSFYHRANER